MTETLPRPPHNIDAEKAVLGGILLYGEDAYNRVSQDLAARDFYLEKHLLVFWAMATLLADGRPIDLIEVQERLKEMHKDGDPVVVTPRDLADLVENGSIQEQLGAYAQIVHDLGTLRRLMQ